jgi:biotin synthase-like enzyme
MAIMAGATRMMIGWLHTGKPKKTNRADEIRKAYKERQARMKKD